MKKRMVKTIVAVMMALTVMLLCMPMSLAAPASGECSENINWTFDDSTGTLTVSGEGILDYYELDEEEGISVGTNPFADFYNEIVVLEVNEGVTEIGLEAFKDCKNLVTVNLPESLEVIGDGAFQGCTAIEEITVPGGTSLSWNVFMGCTALKSARFEEGVTAIPWYTFKDCSSLVWVHIPESMESIEMNSFEGCNAISFAFAGTDEQFNNIELVDNFGYEYTYHTETNQEDQIFEDDGYIDSFGYAEDDISMVIICVAAGAAVVIAIIVAATVIIVIKSKKSKKSAAKKDKNKEYLTY